MGFGLSVSLDLLGRLAGGLWWRCWVRDGL